MPQALQPLEIANTSDYDVLRFSIVNYVAGVLNLISYLRSSNPELYEAALQEYASLVAESNLDDEKAIFAIIEASKLWGTGGN